MRQIFRPPAAFWPLFDQRAILVDGALKIWHGKTRTVLPLLCAVGEDNVLRRIEVGSDPVAGIDEAQQALDAARP